MKKLFAFILLLTASALTSVASTASSMYTLDEQALEAAFNEAEDLTFQMSGSLFSQLANPEHVSGDDNKQLIAGIVALASWVTGIGAIIPIHRFILGTDGRNMKIFCWYFCTLSGCGFILLIDGIMLVIDGDGSKYMDNSKFIMWM